jgi:hypothetical protein
MKSPIRFHIDKANIPTIKVVLAFDLALVTAATIAFIFTHSPWSLLLLAPTLFPTFKITKEEPRQ